MILEFSLDLKIRCIASYEAILTLGVERSKDLSQGISTLPSPQS